MNHPEQNGVDIYGDGIGGESLLSCEDRGNNALVDVGRDRLHEWGGPEEPGPAKTRVLAEAQNDGALPVLRNFWRLRKEDSHDYPDDEPTRILGPGRHEEAGEKRNEQNENRNDIDTPLRPRSPRGAACCENFVHCWHLFLLLVSELFD